MAESEEKNETSRSIVRLWAVPLAIVIGLAIGEVLIALLEAALHDAPSWVGAFLFAVAFVGKTVFIWKDRSHDSEKQK